MKNLKSAFSWNICAIIAKQRKNPSTAAKNFTQALKFDPQNHQIMREATNLYLFSRDFETHSEYRTKVLYDKPKILMNWSGFIAGHHLVF